MTESPTPTNAEETQARQFLADLHTKGTGTDAGAIQSLAQLLALAGGAAREELDALTQPQPCKLTHQPPMDFGQCETHDRTFPLGGTCDHEGLSEMAWLEDREQEQRARAVRAETRLESAAGDLECRLDRDRFAKLAAERWPPVYVAVQDSDGHVVLNPVNRAKDDPDEVALRHYMAGVDAVLHSLATKNDQEQAHGR